MLRGVIKRFLTLILACLMVLTAMPITGLSVKAAGTLTLDVDGLKAQFAKNGAWSASGNKIIGSVTGSAESTCTSASSKDDTLNLTNNKGAAALLSFDYTLSTNGGSVTINGTAVTESGHFEKTIENGENVSIVITSAVGAKTTSIELNNIALVIDADITTTFVPGENGTFSVNGNEITSSWINQQKSTVAYHLKASPSSGYKFIGWLSATDGKYLSLDQEVELYIDKDGLEVMPVFVENDLAVFLVGSIPFTDLDQAITLAPKA